MPIAAPAPAAVPSVSAPPAASRLSSIDVMRGVVMVLMAIDHVRVYSGVPAGGPTPGIFFTRWVTHFCAPAFVFLAGTSAFLHGRKLGQTNSPFDAAIHAAAMIVSLVREGRINPWLFANHPMANPPPEGYTEPWPALPRLLHRGGGAVRAVPVVRPRQGSPARRLASLSVGRPTAAGQP
jgi:Heparan-alpha-glucosaminide N-acetyltransferase, catalytic